MNLTPKQRAFCQYYIETLNASESARRAGYSAKTAFRSGQENMQKPAIREYIDEQLKKMEDERIASASEVLKYLTSVVRGETTEEVVVVEGYGEGCSRATTIDKDVSARDKIKAAELLAKRYGLLTDKVDIQGEVVVFNGEDNLQD